MATNPYYQRVFSAIAGSLARARALLNEFQLIQAGFDKVGNLTLQKEYAVACSDLATALAPTTFCGYFRNTVAMEITNVFASLSQASTAGPVEVSIAVNGLPLLSTNITIDQGETTSTMAATPPVLAIVNVPAHSEFVVAIEDGGADALGLIVHVIGRVSSVP